MNNYDFIIYSHFSVFDVDEDLIIITLFFSLSQNGFLHDGGAFNVSVRKKQCHRKAKKKQL